MNSPQVTQGVFLIFCLGAGSGPMAWAASGHAVIAHVDPGDLGAAAKMTKTIPKPVERILRKQKDLAQCFNGFKEDGYIDKTGVNQFLGKRVQLRDGKRDGLIVAPGSVPCGMGADIDAFWIFEHLGRHYRLLLHTYARIVDVLEKRHNGYHLIRITASSADTEWRVMYSYMRNSGYIPSRCSQRRWKKGVPGSWTKIPCSASNDKPYR